MAGSAASSTAFFCSRSTFPMQRRLTIPPFPEVSVTTYSTGPPTSISLAVMNSTPPELMFRVVPVSETFSEPARTISSGSSSSNRLALRCSITTLNLIVFPYGVNRQRTYLVPSLLSSLIYVVNRIDLAPVLLAHIIVDPERNPALLAAGPNDTCFLQDRRGVGFSHLFGPHPMPRWYMTGNRGRETIGTN